MSWLAVLALAIWIFFQERRLSALERALADLKALPSAPGRAAAELTVALEATLAEPARFVETPDPLPPAPPTQPSMPPSEIAQAEMRPEAEPAPAIRAGAPPFSLETWLSENGLAWIGGAALVIGGALLVGFAAQQGLFTPPVRLACAGALGVLLLAAGEAIRRGRLARFVQHPLASAIASGAGASVLYGAAWAAHALYHFIPAGACAALLAVIAAGLLGLALMRGQALALLALAGGYAAPLVAAGGDWSAPVMVAYLGLLTAVGLTVASERAWRVCGWITFAGAGLWAALALFEPSSLKCLLLGLEPLAVLVALSRVRRDRPARDLAGIAVVFASVLCWAAMGVALERPGEAPWIGALAGLALPVLAALAVRERALRGAFLAAPAIAFVLAAAMGLAVQGKSHGLALPALWLGQGAVLGAAALWATWTRGPRAPALGGAALALAALGALGGLMIDAGLVRAAAPLAAALLLSGGLAMLVRAPGAKDDQLAAEIVSGAAAAALIAAVALGAGWRLAPAGFALVMVFLAALHLRFGWRSLAGLAVTAGVIGFGTLFSGQLWTWAFSGLNGAAWELGSAMAVALGAVAAARLIRRRGDEGALAEAAATLAPLAILAGLFIFLRWFAAGGTGLVLDPLTEASIRTLLLGAAGLAAARALTPLSGALARFRAHGLLGVGLVHAVLAQALLWNPWWGVDGRSVAGPAPFDVLALAYLAPGLIYAAVAWRGAQLSKGARGIYGWGGAALLVLWAGLEIRRLAHGGALTGGPLSIGAVEAAGYCLLWLGAAEVLALLRAQVGAARDRGVGLLRGWAVGFALVMLGLWSNPWTGAAARAFAGAGEALAAWIGYALVTALLARLAWLAAREGRARLADVAEGAAAVLGLLLAALLIRWAFRGQDLMAGQPHLAGEIWAYSAAGALLGVGLLAAGRLGRHLSRYGLILLLATAAKVLLIDMAQLSGMVRVASFLAVGLLMLAAALTARRMGRAARD